MKFRRQLCEGRNVKGGNGNQKGQLKRKRIRSCWFSSVLVGFFFISSFICSSSLLNFHLHSHSHSLFWSWCVCVCALCASASIHFWSSSFYVTHRTHVLFFSISIAAFNIFFHNSCYLLACLLTCRLAFGSIVRFLFFKFTLFGRVFGRASNEHIIFH